MTMATPLSTVRTTLLLSCLSWVRALHCAGVEVAVFVVLLLFESLFTSDLNSSASWLGTLDAASSVAVM